MARISNYLGDIKGKLGGLVFQKNKQGSIIRINNPSSNPFSERGGTARANFASATKMWASLNEDKVASWNYYGANYFRGKNYKVGKIYNGFTAFVALMSRQIPNTKLYGTPEIWAQAETTSTFAPFLRQWEPPGTLNPGVITNIAHEAVTLTLREVRIDPVLDVIAIFDYTPSNYSSPLAFQSPDGSRKYGLIFECGPPNKRVKLGPQKTGLSGVITVGDDWADNQNFFTYKWFSGISSSTLLRNGFAAGQKTVVSAFLISDYGEFTPLGQVFARVEAEIV